MRVIVTGASGYLGLHIAQRLVDQGHSVTALVRAPARLGPLRDRVAIHVADLTTRPDLRPLFGAHDACVHAALIWGEPGAELEMRDAAICARLFDDAGHAGLARIVYLSSTAVHRPFRPWMCATDPLTPTDLYGATKATGEMLLWAACATHDMAGTVLRVGPVVGPPAFASGAFRSHRRLVALADAAHKGEPLEAEPDAGRQFVAAVDVARTVAAVLARPVARETFICADPRTTAWAAIARQLGALTGGPPSASDLPEPPARFDVSRLTDALGVRLDSRDAMRQHLQHLLSTR